MTSVYPRGFSRLKSCPLAFETQMGLRRKTLSQYQPRPQFERQIMAKLDAERIRKTLEDVASKVKEAKTPGDVDFYTKLGSTGGIVLALIEIREAIEENTRTIQSELARMQENLIPRS